ncbi:MAG: ClpXP protease specificity-enhancing factor, partial [Hydrogenovibrio sp.]|nr:ClpXP protease specificity-enhancing factor [Hydrogenovibrio sp.]
MEMISNRPYLIRAMFDWIVDNEWTPHVQVDADFPGVHVPQQYVQNGIIVLNMHPDAVRDLQMSNAVFSFKARFQGVEQKVIFPPGAVLAIFARENGQGMPFAPETYPEADALEEPAEIEEEGQ